MPRLPLHAGSHAFGIQGNAELRIRLGLLAQPVQSGATEMRVSLELLDQHGVRRLVEIAKRILHLHDCDTQLRMSLAQRSRVRKHRNKHPFQEIRTVQQFMREVATSPALRCATVRGPWHMHCDPAGELIANRHAVTARRVSLRADARVSGEERYRMQ